MDESVFDCVIPYIQDNDDLNSVSLVCKKFYGIDSLTRKHLTVHVHFLPEPSRLNQRFPNLESLTLKSYSLGGRARDKCSIPVTPWIQEIVKFKRLNSLSIGNMVVYDSDLQLLAESRGASLRSLDIWGCLMFSDHGLEDIARRCIHLRSLRLRYISIENYVGGGYGKWVHELALHNSVMESLEFDYPFYGYDTEDVTLLAKKCSNSLVSLYIFPTCLINFTQFFKHATKLERFGYKGDADHDYSSLAFPPNICALRIDALLDYHYAFPNELPCLNHCLNQLRELKIACIQISSNCQCYFFKSCPNLEVLETFDTCEDKGLRLIGKFCKKLRKLAHRESVTQEGLIAVAQGCPNLEYLEINTSNLSNKALECVGTHLKNLQDFRIVLPNHGDKMDSPLDNGVQAMLNGCKKLERLDMKYLSLTDVGLKYIGVYGNNLRHIYLTSVVEYSDVGLMELLKGCKKLRKLKLNGYPFNKQAIASVVFSINQSLRYVWLDYDNSAVSVLTRPMISAQIQE